jgi:phospholipase C
MRSARAAISPSALLVASALLLVSCGGNAGLASRPDAANAALPAGTHALMPDAGRAVLPDAAIVNGHPISHVIVVMQENRSFDNLFQGFPGANTVSSGLNSKGESIPLEPVPLESSYGLDHNSKSFFAACDGSPPGQNCKMDGFDKEVAYGTHIHNNPEYGYVPHRESKLYFDMAKQYVLGDDMFTSHIDASFVSHQYIIAGQASGAVDLPTTLWGCGGGANDTVVTLNADRSYGPTIAPCFTNRTIGDELDEKGLPWRFYGSVSTDIAYIWSSYQAISDIYNGPDWNNDVITPPAQFLTDVAHGTLASVTWVTPSFEDSDHATSRGKTGPEWVASIVNAVGESNFWNQTAIFVMWDEWGGWYDHVPPPYEDYDGLGMRVPLLVISPYAKPGYVSHVQYEHGSILRFIEDTFGLGRLAASDTRANSPAADCFNFQAKPRPFVPLPTSLKPGDFVNAPRDPRPPDEE